MKQIPTTGTKVCRTCNRELHVLAFASDPSTSDHLQGECRDCTGARGKRNRSLKRGVLPKDQNSSSSRTRDSFTFGHIKKKIIAMQPAADPLGLRHPPAGD